MKKKLNVLLLFDFPEDFPLDYDYRMNLDDPDWLLQRSVSKALADLGHTVSLFGFHKKIELLLKVIEQNKPDIIFNCADVFNQKSQFDKNIAWLLEMLEIPYTGASPGDLLICNNKALNKKILSFHKVRVPSFHTFYKHKKIAMIKKLNLPCIVKPLCEEASRGISLASVVDKPEALIERIKFIHESMNLDAIVEEYIEGREFYVSVFGNKKITVLPLREMLFGKLPHDEPRIATYKAKWDESYRKRWEINNVPAQNIDLRIVADIEKVCKRAYRALNLQSYARFDIRVTADHKIYIIEPNANPSLLPDDEFALSAKKAGISYDQLVDTLLKLA